MNESPNQLNTKNKALTHKRVDHNANTHSCFQMHFDLTTDPHSPTRGIQRLAVHHFELFLHKWHGVFFDNFWFSRGPALKAHSVCGEQLTAQTNKVVVYNFDASYWPFN